MHDQGGVLLRVKARVHAVTVRTDQPGPAQITLSAEVSDDVAALARCVGQECVIGFVMAPTTGGNGHRQQAAR